MPSRRLWLTAGGGGGGQQRQRRGGSGQRQHGGGGGEAGQGDEEQARGRGRRRYKVKAAVRGGGRPAGWMHDDRGEEGQAGEVEGGGGEGDVEMQQRRRQRRPKNKRRRRGDVEMMDAEDGGGGVRPGAAAGLPCTGCVRLAAMRVARMERVPHKRPALAACRSRRAATQSCCRASSARPPCFQRAQPDLALCPAPQQEYAEGPEPQRFRRNDDDDDDGQRAARAASAAGLAGPPREQVSYGDL